MVDKISADEIRFLLYTRASPTTAHVMPHAGTGDLGTFDSSKRTIFYAHGFQGGAADDSFRDCKPDFVLREFCK